MKTLYDILGVDKFYTCEEIKLSCKQKRANLHPDKNNGQDVGFKEFNVAYTILTDSAKRKNYDETGSIDDRVISTQDKLLDLFNHVVNQFTSNPNIDPYLLEDFLASPFKHIKNTLIQTKNGAINLKSTYTQKLSTLNRLKTSLIKSSEIYLSFVNSQITDIEKHLILIANEIELLDELCHQVDLEIEKF